MLYRVLNISIALVWLVNGLYCKVLNMVPRHRDIVARILGSEHADILTRVIGAAEILMAIWMLSKIKHRFCAITQAVIIAAMNTIEFIMAPDLLLFGRVNALVAVLFIAVILLNEYLPGRPGNAKQ